MNIYYYHTINIEECYNAWKATQYPGHLLYGLTHLHRYGITSLHHTIPFNPYVNRLRLMLYNLKRILFCKETFDAIYAVTHYGLEIVIFLRALRIYRKPIMIWHHSAIVVPKNKFRRLFSKLFYMGIDKVAFFSEILLCESIKTGKIKKENAYVIHWGADLAFYDTLIKTRNKSDNYISTGRERRDFVTLIRAFSKCIESCYIYTTKNGLDIDYESVLSQEYMSPNVHFSIVHATPIEMATIANDAFVIVISCLDYPYTIGLTSLVEAMALGIPVITTNNPTYPIDVDKENIGIKVPYGDVNAWVEAIRYLSTHPEKAKEIGYNGRCLAEKQYNLELFSKEIADVLFSITQPLHKV
jgi:glycosyltransferase involved in cell wall biosynthesis